MERGESAETVWAWARRYVASASLAEKIALAPPPPTWGPAPAPDLRLRPGRPPELVVIPRVERPRSPRTVHGRAQLLHTFWHHELQAAELMCWAILAFPDTPEAFRAGLVRICLDEVRHMGMYAREIERLGFHVGAFPVRDWFWERVPACSTPVEFVSVMGMGFEAANLDHAARFEGIFRDAGDLAAAEVEALVGREEIAHVRFALEWFKRWTGAQSFDEWQGALPEPLSPMLMRGKPLARRARERAGLDGPFLEALEAWQPRGF